MTTMHVSYGFLIATAVLGLIPIFLTIRFRGLLTESSNPKVSDAFSPRVAVIVPCKGLDQGFDENIQAVLDQAQDGIDYYFVVATSDDPAYEAIGSILGRQDGGSRRAQLLVAGIENKRAQKLTNQLKALDNLTRDTDALVFLDSDIRPDPTFVSRLVAPLADAGTGATTGFRWYHPPAPTFGAMLRSTWNAGALPFLVDPKKNFAFGGAMAIKKEVFDKAEIATAWDRALSDDFPFTLGVRRLGLDLCFVPECIGVSYEESSVGQTVEFTNRQSIISRIYFPQLWWSAAIGYSAANLVTFYGVYSLVALVGAQSLDYLIGALCLSLVPMQMLNARLLLASVPRLLPDLAPEIWSRRWHYYFLAPTASFLSLLNTVYSLTTRRIVWRGIEYELVSASETRVVSESGGVLKRQ